MKYLSVCSGIEAATVAWHPLGWECVGVAEIDPFACSVLQHHYPNVRNYGNLNDYASWDIAPRAVDVLVGGTPCQSFSVAGLRKGLADPRGNLALVYLGLVDRIRPRYLVWENVPGVLSSGGGRDFGAFLGALVELGFGFAYRVLDAQWVRVDSHPRAVPQRRKRVFVVGCAGAEWQRAAEILLEPEGVRGNPPTRRASRQRTAVRFESSTGGRRAGEVDEHEPTKGYRVEDAVPEVCGTIADAAHHGGGLNGQDAYSGGILPMSFYSTLGSNGGGHAIDVGVTLKIGGHGASPPAVALAEKTVIVGPTWPVEVAPTLDASWRDRAPHTMNQEFTSKAGGLFVPDTMCYGISSDAIDRSGEHKTGTAATRSGLGITHEVRRLTPRECERLQGFPDDYTLVAHKGKPAADGNRYVAIGNSMAVNVMRWIGARIKADRAR